MMPYVPGPKFSTTCGCGRKIEHIGAMTVTSAGRFCCPHCQVEAASEGKLICHKCGRLCHGAGSYDDDLRYADNVPWRPICPDCRSPLTIVRPLNDAAKEAVARGEIKIGDEFR